MPWIVAAEIAKVTKVGGIVFVETHFSFSSHDRPWHFFQFSDMALRVLFSSALGFLSVWRQEWRPYGWQILVSSRFVPTVSTAEGTLLS